MKCFVFIDHRGFKRKKMELVRRFDWLNFGFEEDFCKFKKKPQQKQYNNTMIFQKNNPT